MVAVPADAAETTPEAETVACVPVVLHDPPGTGSASVIADPAHTAVAPVMSPASGAGSIVTVRVATAVPHILVTE